MVTPTGPQQQVPDKLGRQTFVNRDYLYCGNCDSYCHETSKHCRQCDRCVKHFDHHCIWINNCIGQSNYRPFLVMIISVFVQLALYVAAAIVISLERNFQKFLPQMIATWVYLSLVAVLMFLDFNLVLLHIYLSVKKMTTYQLITAMREEQRMEKIAELNKKRSEEEVRRKAQEEASRVSAQRKDSSNTVKVLPKEERVAPIIEINSRYDNETLAARESPSSNQQNAGENGLGDHPSDNHNTSEQAFKEKPHGKHQSHRNMFDYGAEQQVKSAGQVSIMGDVRVPTEPVQKSLRISKFFSKNKSLHLILPDRGVTNPFDPKKLRLSDRH